MDAGGISYFSSGSFGLGFQVCASAVVATTIKPSQANGCSCLAAWRHPCHAATTATTEHRDYDLASHAKGSNSSCDIVPSSEAPPTRGPSGKMPDGASRMLALPRPKLHYGLGGGVGRVLGVGVGRGVDVAVAVAVAVAVGVGVGVPPPTQV